MQTEKIKKKVLMVVSRPIRTLQLSTRGEKEMKLAEDAVRLQEQQVAEITPRVRSYFLQTSQMARNRIW